MIPFVSKEQISILELLKSKFSNGLKICYNAKRSIDMMLRKREGIKRQASIDTSHV